MKGLPLKLLSELDSPAFRRSGNSSSKRMTFARSWGLMGRLVGKNLNFETCLGGGLDHFHIFRHSYSASLSV